MTLIEQLGAHVARCDAPPPSVWRLLTLHVVDILGAWLAALRTSEGAALLRLRGTLVGGTDVTASRRMRADATGALRLDVMTHCALARLSEIDDIHLASTTTPGAIVIPGALVIAAAFGMRDPAMIAAAMLAGYEVMTRLGLAIGGATALYRGIWPTYFTAPTAMAAVAARLFGLDATATAQALAIALVRSSPGVGHRNAATTARWLAVGQAAEAGLMAAFAARAGFTADLGLLDGPYLRGVYDIDIKLEAVTLSDLEEDTAPAMLEEVSFKPWCAARQTMAATQGLIEILDAGVAAEAIANVHASVPPPHHRMVAHGVTVGDRSSFLTSLPYRLATAAFSPGVAFDIAQSPPALPAEIRAFMDRVVVRADERLLADFPRQWTARVAVETPAGTQERLVTYVPGDPQRPFDSAAVQRKFLRFAGPAVRDAAAAKLLESTLGLFDGAITPAQLMTDVEAVIVRVQSGCGPDVDVERRS
jgi:2-methylcitrate dehydratase PrpD